MDVRLIEKDQQMLVALGAVQHALELLDKRLSPLRIGPAEQLLGLLPRQLASTTACFHDSLLPQHLASTTACFHDSLLPRQLASTTACFHDSLLPRQLASTTACFHDSLLPRQLASTTACGGAGPRGSSRGSTSGRSARGPSRPDGARSSVAMDQPPRRAERLPPARRERLPCAGRRRPHHEALLRSSRKGGTAAGAAKDESVGATFVLGVHPIHHGLRMAPGARGHTRGARALCDLIESKGPLTGAGMGRAQGDVAHILRGPTPARIINA